MYLPRKVVRLSQKLLFSCLFVNYALAISDKEATKTGKVTCVYPLSGQYAPIARYTYYGLLLFGIVARHEIWLIAGALTTAMTYSGTAAIHAFILVCTTGNPVFDLDLLGVWAVLSAGLFALWPLLSVSSTFRNSPSRPIFGLWAVLISAGVLFCTAPIRMQHNNIDPCYNAAGELLTQSNQLDVSLFNCTYTCFNSHRLLRGPGEIIAVPTSQLFGSLYDVFMAMSAYITQACITITCFFLPWPRSWNAKIEKKLHKLLRLCPNRQVSSEADIERGDSEKACRKRRRKLIIGTVLFYINQMTSVVTIALNEYYLLSSRPPVTDQPYSISQWGSIIAITLAVMAAGINKYLERRHHGWKSASNSFLTRSASCPSPRSGYQFNLGFKQIVRLIQFPAIDLDGRKQADNMDSFQSTNESIVSERPALKRHCTW